MYTLCAVGCQFGSQMLDIVAHQYGFNFLI